MSEDVSPERDSAGTGGADQDHIERSPEYWELAKRVFETVTINLIEDGRITEEDIDSNRYLEIIRDLVSDEGVTFDLTTDHTPELLRKARRSRKGNSEDALLYYALFVEHKLNGLIRKLGSRSDTSISACNGLIRESRLSSKATWALELLGAPPFGADTVKAMGRLADARNAYVHYKWHPTPEDRLEAVRNLCEIAEEIVSAISNYENKELYGGRRRALVRKLQRGWSPETKTGHA